MSRRLQAAVVRHQFLMGPALDFTTAVEHDDQVAVPDGAEAMGDDQASDASAAQGFVDAQFGEGIERAGRLVENQDGGIRHQSPGDFETLLLAAAEVAPALQHGSVVALGPGR